MPIPADQRWFWTERWQQREREVDAHVATGEVDVHADGDAFLDHLDQLNTCTEAAQETARSRRRRAPMTIDDLRRAEEAAADLDDLGVMASAWECGTARDW